MIKRLAIVTAVLLAACGSGAAGTHSITLELADDSHNPLKDGSGNTIQSTITGIITH